MVNKTVTTKNSNITWEFSSNFVKRNCKKRLFLAIFSKNFNWQVISLWVIISYKIIKFASISYKSCCEKYFVEKYFAKKLTVISCKFFFITKFISISYKKKFKTKLAENMSFFSSVYCGCWHPQYKFNGLIYVANIEIRNLIFFLVICDPSDPVKMLYNV